MPSWAAMALRINALLLGSLLRNSARSASTLKATTAVLGVLRDIVRPSPGIGSDPFHLGAAAAVRKRATIKRTSREREQAGRPRLLALAAGSGKPDLLVLGGQLQLRADFLAVFFLAGDDHLGAGLQ